MKDDRFFIEQRQNNGDYAIRKPGSERASGIAPTQREAIDRAKELIRAPQSRLNVFGTPLRAAGINGASRSFDPIP